MIFFSTGLLLQSTELCTTNPKSPSYSAVFRLSSRQCSSMGRRESKNDVSSTSTDDDDGEDH